MKIRTLSLVAMTVVLVTAVSCTAVRTYDDRYPGGYYTNAPFYGSIDPFTGFYYNSTPYAYYSPYYGGRAYYYSSPRTRVSHYGEAQRNYSQQQGSYGQAHRNWNSQSQQQNRSESRNKVFGNNRR